VVETSDPPAWAEPLAAATSSRLTLEQAADLERVTTIAAGGPHLAILPPVEDADLNGYFAGSLANVRRAMARCLGFRADPLAAAGAALWLLCERPFAAHLLYAGGRVGLSVSQARPTRACLSVWEAGSAVARFSLKSPPANTLFGRLVSRAIADLPGCPELCRADEDLAWQNHPLPTADDGPRPRRGSWDRLRHLLDRLGSGLIARRFRDTVVSPYAASADGCPAHGAAEAAFLWAFARCPWGDDTGGAWADVVRDLMFPTVEGAAPPGSTAALANLGVSYPTHDRPDVGHTVLHPPICTAADRLRLALLSPLGSSIRIGGPATLEGYLLDGFSYLHED
jgi:hypothetical protein